MAKLVLMYFPKCMQLFMLCRKVYQSTSYSLRAIGTTNTKVPMLAEEVLKRALCM